MFAYIHMYMSQSGLNVGLVPELHACLGGPVGRVPT